MSICDCCRALQARLSGEEAAYACTNSTPSEQKKKFSIKSRTKRFCRVGMDALMPHHETKCDYAFANCPQDTRAQRGQAFETWFFVELAGDRKSTQHCYDQLKESILYVRAVMAQSDGGPRAIVGFIIGSEPTTHRGRKKSDLVRELKDRFVRREKLGRRLVVEKGPKWVEELA